VSLDLFAVDQREGLAQVLFQYVQARRWYRSKSRSPRGARIADLLPLRDGRLVILDVTFERGASELYVVPLVRGDGPVVARLADGTELVDGLAGGQCAWELLALARDGRSVPGEKSAIHGESSATLRELAARTLQVTVPRAEQTNSTLFFEQQVLMKVYRMLDTGESPELEIGRFLTQQGGTRSPAVLGAITYDSHTVAVVHQFVPNEGDAWTRALADVRAHLEGRPRGFDAATLGRRTAELHLALSNGTAPAFAPELLSDADRQSLVGRARTMLLENLGLLARKVDRLPQRTRSLARRVLEAQSKLEDVLDRFRDAPTTVTKTRVHGDLHLGQVLVQGNDFVIIDFEGEPARPLPERRAKSSPLRDVMGMVRSFDYAPEAVLRESGGDPPRARRWTEECTADFLRSYFDTVGAASFAPADPAERERLLSFYQMEKVVYEVGYELNNRPDWVEIPVRGLASMIGATE
jgi:maltose alpha-D-glucosyltransferase/alpha-amylase